MQKPFVPRDRKQRKTKRRKTDHDEEGNQDGSSLSANAAPAPAADSNAEIIVPLSKAELAEKKKQKMMEEMKESMPKMSSKKQKRFNKYIVCNWRSRLAGKVLRRSRIPNFVKKKRPN